MNRVLVTGATGFVGGHLIRTLGDHGFAVTAAVRKASPSLSLPANGRAATVGEIAADTDWSSALDEAATVVHLAARVHQMKDEADDPLTAFRAVNLDGTMALYRQAKARGVAKFVFLSSVKAMGEGGTDRPLSDDDPARPQDPYGQSKWETEQALMAEASSAGPKVVILRPPLLYGPGAKGNMLTLFKACHRGLPLPLGAVKARRSLLYVENLTDAIRALINTDALTRSQYLISDPDAPSVADLVSAIYRALGRPDRSINVPPNLLRGLFRVTGRSDLAQRLLDDFVIDGGNLARELDWQAPFGLEQGLARTAAWFNQCFE